MQWTRLDLFFWTAGLLEHLVLLAVIVIRQRFRLFPWFTSFIFASVCQTVSLYAIHRWGTKAQYFYAYWILAMLGTMLQLGVFYEIASIVFRPVGVWAADVRRQFALLVLISFAVAAVFAWFATPPAKLPLQTVFIKGSLFVAVLMSELFIVTASLSTRVGLVWRSHVLQITQGLGTYAMTTLVVEAADSYFGISGLGTTYQLLQHFRIAVYLCVLVYWTGALWHSEPQRHEITAEMRSKLFSLQGQLAYQLGRIRSGADGL
jgi:hypothetical protein